MTVTEILDNISCEEARIRFITVNDRQVEFWLSDFRNGSRMELAERKATLEFENGIDVVLVERI